MKKVIKKLTVGLLCLCMVLSLVACADGGGSNENEQEGTSEATQLTHGKVWSAPSSVKILRDDVKYANKQAAKLSYHAVRNEHENYQLLITAEKDISHFELQVNDLKNGKEVISKDNVTVYVQKYVYSTDSAGNGYIPDPLIPMENADAYDENVIKAGQNGALWVTIYIPEDTKAGVYEGTFRLVLEGTEGEETLDVPVSVDVYDYTLTEEVNARTLFSWRYIRVAAGELDGSIEMMEKYYDFFEDYRISLQTLPVESLSGQEYIDALLEHYDDISNYCIMNIKGEMTGGLYSSSYRDIVMEEYLLIAENSTAEKNLFDKASIFTVDEPHLTEESGRRGLISQLQQVNAMVEEVIDTIAADTSARFKEFKKIKNWEDSIRDIPNIVTLNYMSWLFENEDSEDAQTMLSLMNCICPYFTHVSDSSIEQLERMAEKYDLDLWWYGCVAPRPPAPTYHISDLNLLSPRTVSWLQSKYDIQGNLYWDVAGYTYETQDESLYYAVDLYEKPYHYDGWTAGDGFLVYPGAAYDVYGPIPSLRLMSIRDGMEEYEILENLKTVLENDPDAFDDTITTDSIMNMFYDPVALSTSRMYTDGEAELDFVTLRKNLLEFITGFQAGLGFVLGDISIIGETAEVTYYVQDGATVIIDGETQKPVEGNEYKYEMDLAQDTYIHLTVQNSSGETKKYNQFVGTPLYVLNAMSDESHATDITVTEGSTAEIVTSDTYSTDGTALHVKLNGVLTGDIIDDATFKPAVTFDFSMFGDVDVTDLQVIRMDIYNPGAETEVSVNVYSGDSYDSLGTYQIKEGKTILELDMTKLMSGLANADRMVLEFANINAEGTVQSYEFYVDNMVGE